jgi:DUF1680 family protein
VIYCLEQVDLPQDVDSEDVYLSEATVLHVAAAPEGLDTPAITATGAVVRESTREPLYSGVRTRPDEREIGQLTLVPYFRWGNRRQAAMRVWIPTR